MVKKKLLLVLYSYNKVSFKSISLPFPNHQLARKTLKEMDDVMAKEIYKLDILC